MNSEQTTRDLTNDELCLELKRRGMPVVRRAGGLGAMPGTVWYVWHIEECRVASESVEFDHEQEQEV